MRWISYVIRTDIDWYISIVLLPHSIEPPFNQGSSVYLVKKLVFFLVSHTVRYSYVSEIKGIIVWDLHEQYLKGRDSLVNTLFLLFPSSSFLKCGRDGRSSSSHFGPWDSLEIRSNTLRGAGQEEAQVSDDLMDLWGFSPPGLQATDCKPRLVKLYFLSSLFSHGLPSNLHSFCLFSNIACILRYSRKQFGHMYRESTVELCLKYQCPHWPLPSLLWSICYKVLFSACTFYIS